MGVLVGNPVLTLHAIVALRQVTGSLEMLAVTWALSGEPRVTALFVVLQFFRTT